MSADVDTSYQMSADAGGAASHITVVITSQDPVECAVMTRRLNAAIERVITQSTVAEPCLPRPEPEPKKPEKKTAQKKKKPAKKSSKGGRPIIQWTPEELNVLTHALSSDEAVRLYQAEFGDKRSENGVRQKWIKMQKEKSSPSVSEPTEVPSEKLEIYPDARVRISPTDESSVELEDFDGEEGTVHKISNDNQAFVETDAGKFWIPLRDLLVIS